MTTRSRLLRWCGPACLAVCLVASAPADETKPRLDPSQAPDVQDIVFLGKARPVMIRLHLQIDGKPYSQAWDAYVQKLFKFCDRNNDGHLDKEEVKRLPPATMMHNLVRGNYYAFYNMAILTLAQVDDNGDDRGDLDEVKRYYADKASASPIQLMAPYIGYAQATGNRVTTGLLRHLGSKDGKIELSKLTAARADDLVARLDSGDDETIDTTELTAGIPQENVAVMPGQPAMMPVRPNRGAPLQVGDSSFLLIPKEKGASRLSERLGISKELIKRYDRDNSGKLTRNEIGLDAASFKMLDRNGDEVLDSVELLRYFVVAPDIEMTASLGKRDDEKQPAIQLTPGTKSNLASKVTQASTESLMLGLNTVQMELRAVSLPPYYRQTAQQRNQYFTQLFDMADQGKKGFIDMQQDMKAPNFAYMKGLFDLADRDGDGKVQKKEFEETIQVHLEAFGTTSTLTVNETSRGLFEALDTNRDGRLSVRELRKAREKLAEFDLNGDGFLEESEVPVQVQLAVGTGSQAAPLRQPGFGQPVQIPVTTVGPLWFRKMDRNGDGDVSRREFLGSPASFKKLDLDSDGYISREEAEKADATLRQKQVRKD